MSHIKQRHGNFQGWLYAFLVAVASCPSADGLDMQRQLDELMVNNMTAANASSAGHVVRVSSGGHAMEKPSLLSSHFLVLVMLSVAVVLPLSLYLYRWYETTTKRRRIRQEVLLEVQTQLSDYAELFDDNNRTAVSF